MLKLAKVYDIKTASPYSYERKFDSWETLASSDDFGYLGQGFGYAIAEGCRFGGWIVINKSTGQIKVIEIPDDEYLKLEKKYFKEIEDKVSHINEDRPIPPCEGVVEETFYKRPTGNLVLGEKCLFCNHKDKCHPGIKYLPQKASKAEKPRYVYYVKMKDEE